MQASSDPASQMSRRLVWTSYVVGAFGLGISQQANFLIPLRARELGASIEVIGLIVASSALVPTVLSVPVGRVIDRLGSRRSFITGASLTAVVGLLFMAATSYWALLGLQIMLGTVRTMAWLSSQSYITGFGAAANRTDVTGKFAFFSNVGTMVGPLVAGLVAQLVGFRFAFGWLALYATVFAILGVTLREIHVPDSAAKAKGQGAGFRTAASHLRLRGMQVALLLTFARLWNDRLWTSFFPVYLVDAGFEPGLIGTVIFTKGLVATALAPTVGYWSRFMSRQSLAALGLGCGAVGLALSPHVAALPWVYLAPVLVGIGAGFSLPLLLAIVSDAAPEGQRGVALGLRMTVNQVAGGGAPLVFAPLVAAFGMVFGFAAGGVFAGALLIASRTLHAMDTRVPIDATRS